MSKVKRNKVQDDKESAALLISSITQDDETYISEFLIQKNCHRQIKYLEDDCKNKLCTMLLEFLNTPLRLKALDLLKKLANTKVLQSLRQRALSFDKMIYLKGKIDFLKIRNTRNVKELPEKEIK